MLITERDCIIYKLGRNAQENFQLIDEANKINSDYWWFHLEDYPSGHCIVHTKDLDKSVLIFAGSLVKSHSKLKNQKKVKIIYVQIKYIRKTKTVGEVILNQKPNVITL
jgi:predicted ribosome quality control (RQC) complex YloA/Tae2 family protein